MLFRSNYSDRFTRSLFWWLSVRRRMDFARMWFLRKYLVVSLLPNSICVSWRIWEFLEIRVSTDDVDASAWRTNDPCLVNGRGERTLQVTGKSNSCAEVVCSESKSFSMWGLQWSRDWSCALRMWYYGSKQTLYKKLKGRSCSGLMFGYGRSDLRKVAGNVQGDTWTQNENEIRDMTNDLR